MNNTLLWQRLENEVQRRIEDFPGVASTCVKDLDRGDGFAVNGDEAFPTASTIKIHVLTQRRERLDAGRVRDDAGTPVQW